MEMIDMGKKQEASTAIPVGEGKQEIRISYPGFSICGDKIPKELKTSSVGNMCRLEIIVKKIGDSIDTYGKQEPRIEVEIHKLGYLGKAGRITKEEYLKKSDEEREAYDKEQLGEDEEKEGKSDASD